MKDERENRVIVIGAGLSGLAAARALKELGVPVRIIEQRRQLAEPWRRRHPQLRLNIHRHFASLPGLEMPPEDGAFVRRDTVVDYLERYACDSKVPIESGRCVRGVHRKAAGWRIVTDQGIYDCEHVVVATGRDRLPYLPEWPGRDAFSGELRHAAELGSIDQYPGRDVLVIGAGNSGTDVLNHLSRIETGRVRVSVRHGPAIVPTRLLGVPLHRLARLFELTPEPLLDPLFAATQWLAFGNLERHGLYAHPDGGGTRLLRDGVAFALDDGFVAALKSARFEIVPETVGFEADGVRLADGRTLAPDIVICATGYRAGLEPLFGAMDVLDANGYPRHPMGEPDASNPGLWFTGYRPIFSGYFHAAGVAASRIARGVAKGPPDVAAPEGLALESSSIQAPPETRSSCPAS